MEKAPVEYNEKQQAIIESAQKLFAENGFDGTSVRDIAQEAGINVAMISYYFGSKEKLMEAIFEQKSNNTRLKVENLLQDESLSPTQKVNVLIDDYIDKFLSEQKFHRIMIREQLVEKDTAISTSIYELKKRNLISIRRLLQHGQKCGVFKKHIDVVLMTATLVGTVSQMITSQRFYREINNLEELTEQEFQKQLKKKLGIYLKNLFKVMLTYEA